MTIFEVLTVVLSALALGITIFTWFRTVQSLKQAVRQNENSIRVFQSEAMNSITTAHRDLYLNILKDDTLTKIIANQEPPENYRKKMLGTVLINHCNSIFLYAQKSLIEDDDWFGLQNDIKDFFLWPAVKERWPEIRSFYSQGFQDFVDKLIVRGRPDLQPKAKL